MIISQSLVAKKYAKAYLNIYEKSLNLSDVQAIGQFALFLKKHKNIMLLVCSAGVTADEKLAIVSKLLDHCKVTAVLKKLVDLLLAKNELCLLDKILQDISCLYKKRNNIIDLAVMSAQELEQDELEKFKSFFQDQSGKKLITSKQVNPELIAGVRLLSDTFLWDYSIASRLKALRHKLFVEG